MTGTGAVPNESYNPSHPQNSYDIESGQVPPSGSVDTPAVPAPTTATTYQYPSTYARAPYAQNYMVEQEKRNRRMRYWLIYGIYYLIYFIFICPTVTYCIIVFGGLIATKNLRSTTTTTERWRHDGYGNGGHYS